MDISKIVEAKIAEQIDISKYTKEIDEAINDYFKSESFKEVIADSLYDENIGWEIGRMIAPMVVKELKGKIKITI